VAAVAEFQSLLAGLAADLRDRISRLVSVAQRLDSRELMTFVTDVFPELATPYVATVGDLAASWYEAQLPGSDYVAVPAGLPPAGQLGASARWAMLQNDPVVALDGSATRYLFQQQRDTVVSNAAVEGVRWARHASANACGFCRMLATRGAVYRSEASAKAVKHADASGHDHCHCIAVPQRDGIYVPAPHIEQWKRDYKSAVKAGARTAGQIANAMDYAPGGRRNNNT
jgi:hypothetical protein